MRLEQTRLTIIHRLICMAELLEQAIAKLKTRPVSEQDSIAALILEELQDDEYLGFSAFGEASPLENGFRQSWKQATAGNTLPLSQLWESSEVD
jgi:hypothetical protein